MPPGQVPVLVAERLPRGFQKQKERWDLLWPGQQKRPRREFPEQKEHRRLPLPGRRVMETPLEVPQGPEKAGREPPFQALLRVEVSGHPRPVQGPVLEQRKTPRPRTAAAGA